MEFINNRQPLICECGNHAFVAITKGFVTFVDVEDIQLLKSKWYASVQNNIIYSHQHTMLNGRRTSISLHRKIITGCEKVDHKNNNGLDNRKDNIRPATNKENNCNHLRIGKESGYIGVKILKNCSPNRYSARIYHKAKSIHIGCYATAEEAALARDQAAIEMYGEFATLNFQGKK